MPRDRPRLWESFKRALGGSPQSNERAPEIAQPSAYVPFLPPDETSNVRPVADSAAPPASAEPTESAREAGVTEIDEIVPKTPDDRATPTIAPPTADAGALRPARLARGLASFSRYNPDREKKFRHILSDEGGSTPKKP